ncbi:hypothetical protein JOC95_000931 [Bacillus tianshenii]|uniref:Uncharacterized protein n=1 Tax=Sutcliffiella tianshenii TaxID=1463404 RepID=A0ABS2NX95_9BACI|nr:hypothetical protein [Bacillus tianshenii]MBM7619082.1 hypothetical protein [Bacillus tianshenii]
MSKRTEQQLTADMLEKYYEYNKKKKEIEAEMNHLKEVFHQYFDHQLGSDDKGEVLLGGFKLQRQVRKTEKYREDTTIKRLEELKMEDLIQVVKKPDEAKIKSAIQLGLLKEEDLEGCLTTSTSLAISVKPVTPR